MLLTLLLHLMAISKTSEIWTVWKAFSVLEVKVFVATTQPNLRSQELALTLLTHKSSQARARFITHLNAVRWSAVRMVKSKACSHQEETLWVVRTEMDKLSSVWGSNSTLNRDRVHQRLRITSKFSRWVSILIWTLNSSTLRRTANSRPLPRTKRRCASDRAWLCPLKTTTS